MRIAVNLSDEQVEALRQLGERKGLSRAELVRQAVAEYLERYADVNDPDAAFGVWRNAPLAGGAQVENLRDEWEK